MKKKVFKFKNSTMCTVLFLPGSLAAWERDQQATPDSEKQALVWKTHEQFFFFFLLFFLFFFPKLTLPCHQNPRLKTQSTCLTNSKTAQRKHLNSSTHQYRPSVSNITSLGASKPPRPGQQRSAHCSCSDARRRRKRVTKPVVVDETCLELDVGRQRSDGGHRVSDLVDDLHLACV